MRVSQKSGWQYFGNEESYQRSTGVKTNGKNLNLKKTHYPIIALLRGSHGLSAQRALSRPEGAQPRSWALEGPLDFYWPYSPTMLEVGKVSIQGPILSKISTRRHTASMGIL